MDRKWPLAAVVSLSLILLATTWSITWQRLEAELQLVNRNSQLGQESLGIIISENLRQVLDRGGLLALASSEFFEGNRKDAANRLSAMLSADRAFLRIALYNNEEAQVYASSPATDSVKLTAVIGSALKEARHAEFPRLQVGPLSDSVEEAWQVPLLFPVIGSDRKIQGLFLAVLDLGYLLRLYKDIDIGLSGVLQVLNEAGHEIVRAHQGGLEVTESTWKTNQFPIGQGSNGTLETDLFSDGRAYQVSFRHLANYPFLVLVSREVDELRSAYSVTRSRFVRMLWLLTAMVLGATFWIARAFRRRERLFLALAAANQDKQKLIVQLEEEKSRAVVLASHDALTGLPNRRLFHELGASHIHRAKRSHQHYGLLYLDLDRFKNINDTLGHHIGDLLLQTVATRLRCALRESDVIARIGGDEFCILLTGLDSVEDMAAVATKIVEWISQPCINLGGHDLQISPSVGIAVFPRDGHNVETLSRHADAAMYQSKQAGRGRYTFYDPSLNPVSDRLFELEQRLPRAIADGELLLHFQPKVRLSDYRIVGLEALVRWQHPQHGLIYPGEFVPMAEAIGLDVALGDWVAKACCKLLANWQSEGLALVPVAFNVSARQLRDEQLPQRIATCIASFGIPAQMLEVEITESSLIDSFEIAARVLRDLERIGVGIALDDFGNGYSSLAYIRSLPIHTIKIDRSFINDIRNSRHDAVIVESIVALAHNLKMRVVAEGVELLDQLIHLKTIGCDEVQGYFLSRPVPADMARQLIMQGILLPPI